MARPFCTEVLATLNWSPSSAARALASSIAAVAARIGVRRVALTGGCFQNRHLLEWSVEGLRGGGFEPFWHRLVPPNDGGISVGQAAWAARLRAQG